MCAEDRDWFNRLLNDCIQDFDCSFEEVVPCQPVLYGDFMIPEAQHKVYKLIQDKEKVSGDSQCFNAKQMGSWLMTSHTVIWESASFS